MSPMDHADTRAGRRGGTPPKPDETGLQTPPTAVTATRSLGAFAAAVAVVVLLLVSFVAPANGAPPRTTPEAVESELMCVTCGTPLAQSNAPQAIEEREEIERLVAQGRTKEQAVDEMVAIYGDQVLIDPPEQGLRVARIAIPGAAGVFGILLLLVLVRRWRGQPGGPEDDGGASDHESSSPGMTDDDRRRLDADLKRYA